MDKNWWLNYLKGMVKPVAALAVVLLAMMLSYFQKLELEKDMIHSIFRSFIQLSIIGFVLQFIFSQTSIAWICLAYLFMCLNLCN
ncbi:Protein ALUMINUM SENSITIVE 3 [Bienertia sinuspersici]